MFGGLSFGGGYFGGELPIPQAVTGQGSGDVPTWYREWIMAARRIALATVAIPVDTHRVDEVLAILALRIGGQAEVTIGRRIRTDVAIMLASDPALVAYQQQRQAEDDEELALLEVI